MTCFHISTCSQNTLPSKNNRKHIQLTRKSTNSHWDPKIIVLILLSKPFWTTEWLLYYTCTQGFSQRTAHQTVDQKHNTGGFTKEELGNATELANTSSPGALHAYQNFCKYLRVKTTGPTILSGVIVETGSSVAEYFPVTQVSWLLF